MIQIRKMMRSEVSTLYDIALSAFQPDKEKFDVYPPLLKIKNKSFLPPLLLGRTILNDDKIIGGVFLLVLGKHAEIGSIFIDPSEQGKGVGHIVFPMLEQMYPKVQIWKLDTPSENHHLHRFYESLGYTKIGEKKDQKSGINVFCYEKHMDKMSSH